MLTETYKVETAPQTSASGKLGERDENVEEGGADLRMRDMRTDRRGRARLLRQFARARAPRTLLDASLQIARWQPHARELIPRPCKCRRLVIGG